MYSKLLKIIKNETLETTRQTVKKEVTNAINDVKEKIDVETDKMVSGKKGKMLIFASIGIGCFALAVAIGKSSAKTIVVNVYTCK